jgi:hypothetical protein
MLSIAPSREAAGSTCGVRMLAGQPLSISTIDAQISDMETQ